MTVGSGHSKHIKNPSGYGIFKQSRTSFLRNTAGGCVTATTRPVSPKENLYGAELQSVCHSDAQDEQRKNCVDREEISEGERIDDRELSRCQAIETSGVR